MNTTTTTRRPVARSRGEQDAPGQSLTTVPYLRFDPDRGNKVLRWTAPVVTLAVVLTVWTIVSTQLLDPSRQFLLPSPLEVWQAGFADEAGRREILTALWSTTKVALVGLGLAIVIGGGAAVAMSQSRWIEASFYPYAVILQTIPILAMVPLLGFWFGYEFTSRMIVCVLIALFPIITNTLFGIRSVDSSLHDQFSLWQVSRWQRLTRLQLPAALPAALTGCRISAGLAVIGSIIADFFFRQGQPGIGRLIDTYRQSLDTDLMMAALAASSMVGVLLFLFFGVLLRGVEERRTTRR
jgi:NitT/TauT family transport system permease protein